MSDFNIEIIFISINMISRFLRLAPNMTRKVINVSAISVHRKFANKFDNGEAESMKGAQAFIT